MVLWWIANALFLAVVVLTAVLAHRVIVQALAIRRYADDILVHGAGLSGTLEPLPALEGTRQLVATAGAAAAAYAQALERRIVR